MIKMQLPHSKKAMCLLMLFVGAYFCSNVIDTRFRYIFYLLPCFTFILLPRPLQTLQASWQQKSKPNAILQHFIFLNVAIVIYSGLLLLIRQDFFSRFLEESIFVLSPILFVYLLVQLIDTENSDSYVKILFWGIVLSYISAAYEGFAQVLQVQENWRDSWMHSNLSTEHTSSFLFGLFAIYFLYRVDKPYIIMALLLTLISFKRIALIGVLSVCIFLILHHYLKFFFKKKKLILAFILAGHFLFVQGILILSSFRYDKEIIQLFGISTQGITSGRMKTFTPLLEELDGFSLWGHGLGKSSHILVAKQHYLSLLHSDILKLILEIGIIGFIIWLIAFYWPFLKQPALLGFPLYLNCLFLTDNTFIYFEVLALFYFLILMAIQTKQTNLLHEKLAPNAKE